MSDEPRQCLIHHLPAPCLGCQADPSLDSRPCNEGGPFHLTGINLNDFDFCPRCGAPVTDKGREMAQAAKENEVPPTKAEQNAKIESRLYYLSLAFFKLNMTKRHSIAQRLGIDYDLDAERPNDASQKILSRVKEFDKLEEFAALLEPA